MIAIQWLLALNPAIAYNFYTLDRTTSMTPKL